MKRDKRGHLLLEPKDCDCHKDLGSCNICDGGLAYCISCYGGEIELEESCASRRRRLRKNEYVLLSTVPGTLVQIHGPEGGSGVRPVVASIDACKLTLARQIVAAVNRGELRWMS